MPAPRQLTKQIAVTAANETSQEVRKRISEQVAAQRLKQLMLDNIDSSDDEQADQLLPNSTGPHNQTNGHTLDPTSTQLVVRKDYDEEVMAWNDAEAAARNKALQTGPFKYKVVDEWSREDDVNYHVKKAAPGGSYHHALVKVSSKYRLD